MAFIALMKAVKAVPTRFRILAYVYPNGDAVSNVDVVYLCRDYTGHTHRQQGEVNRLRWFAPQDMPPMAEIMPPNRPALRQYLESVGVSALT